MHDTAGRTKAEDGKCPDCGAELEHVDTRRYETLSEHVCRPNAEPHLKPGYACPNQFCDAHQDGARWLVDYGGEGPYYVSDEEPTDEH